MSKVKSDTKCQVADGRMQSHRITEQFLAKVGEFLSVSSSFSFRKVKKFLSRIAVQGAGILLCIIRTAIPVSKQWRCHEVKQ